MYASAYLYEGKIHPGLTNIGMRPTVNDSDNSPLTETVLLDGHYQLYGTHGTVMLLKFIRPEMKFGSVDELKEQMQKDQEAVGDYHKNRRNVVRFDGYI